MSTLGRVKLICKSNLNAGNLISGLNDWAIGMMRYSGGIIDWTKENFHDIENKKDNEQMFAPKK